MRRVRALVLLPILASAAGCADSGESEGRAPASRPASAAAAAALADVRARGGDLVPSGVVAALDPMLAGLSPRLEGGSPDRPAEVTLPGRIGGMVRLTDRSSGMTLGLEIVGAHFDVPELVEGLAVYPGALGRNQHVVQAVTSGGIEDLVALESPSAVHYRVDLERGVGGLRLVANTIEFVDAAGVPRLRMYAPWARDALGQLRQVRVRVMDCDYDESPASPWGRRPTAPAAAACTVAIDVPAASRGPLVIDPFWQTTGTMTQARFSHAAALLDSGKILVSGGNNLSNPLHTSEVYDPSTQTWATTGAMIVGRHDHTLTNLGTGKVLASAGFESTGSSKSAELYDEATGMWATTGSLTMTTYGHTATMLPSGRVIVIGGQNNGLPLETSSIYDPAAGTWTAGPTMQVRRFWHSSTLLLDNRILVVGGYGQPLAQNPNNSSPLEDAELYDSADNAFHETDALSQARYQHQAARLLNGDVIAMGGLNGSSILAATVDVWSPATGNWSKASNLNTVRTNFVALPMLSGQVLALGGTDDMDHPTGSSECYDFKTRGWTTVGSLMTPRDLFAATTAADGSILAEGGLINNSTQPTGTAELFTPRPGGAACDVGCECLSGLCASGACCAGTKANGEECKDGCDCSSSFCVDGVCCTTPCDAACESCAAIVKGSGADGVCGPVAKGNVDPRDKCNKTSAESCGHDGLCDGAGHCTIYPAKTVCIPLACTGSEVVEGECNGSGQCVEQSRNCSPYVCSPDGTCRTSCKNIHDCAEGFVCTLDHECIPSPQNTPVPPLGCCGVAGRGSEQPWYLALLPAAVALAFARRRARRA